VHWPDWAGFSALFRCAGSLFASKDRKKSVFSRLSLSDDQAMKKPDPGAILLSQDAFAGACLQANGYGVRLLFACKQAPAKSQSLTQQHWD